MTPKNKTSNENDKMALDSNSCNNSNLVKESEKFVKDHNESKFERTSLFSRPNVKRNIYEDVENFSLLVLVFCMSILLRENTHTERNYTERTLRPIRA